MSFSSQFSKAEDGEKAKKEQEIKVEAHFMVPVILWPVKMGGKQQGSHRGQENGVEHLM